MRTPVVLSTLLCFACVPAMGQPDSLDSLLPADTSGWHLTGPPQVFVKDELFKMIDGGAALYQEYGFDQAISGEYQGKEGQTVDVEVYAMADVPAACGIFGITAAAGDQQLTLGDDGELGEYFLVFRKGRHVVTVSGQTSDKPTMDGVKLLGRAVEAKIDSGGQAPGFVKLFDSLVGKGSRPIYLRGAIAVGNFYMFAPQNIFNVREGITGERDSTRFFVFRYRSAQQSAQSFRAAVEALRANDKFSHFTSSSTRFEARDRDGNVLKASVVGHWIAIVTGPREERSTKMEKQVLEVLGNS